MKIAILGWGSLIWQPKELKYKKGFGWNKNGPFLPIEFSRISNNGRLTLVIDKNAAKVQTLYAISAYQNLDKVILDLVKREETSKERIGWYNKTEDNFFSEDFEFKDNIKEWISHTDYDAVVWTNLGKRFKDKIKKEHNLENVIEYLEQLTGNTKVIAEEYIRKAPQQIKTAVRKEIEEKLVWTFIETEYNE